MIKAGDKVVCLTKMSWLSAYSNQKIAGPTKGEICYVEQVLGTLDGVGLILKGYQQYGVYALQEGPIKNFEKIVDDYSSASNEISKKLTKEVKEQEKQKEVELEPEVA